ncbi:hypothetical protein E2C01_092284 [Portunus trituberculatus]|uniref:Uncharacterized protein n=1 Tax=Portunus trituberculatus TaxID=210409 RepID=A0A5B7JV23_PORTR|nr:hypothetical protein [Portunus trituberculatus]
MRNNSSSRSNDSIRIFNNNINNNNINTHPPTQHYQQPEQNRTRTDTTTTTTTCVWHLRVTFSLTWRGRGTEEEEVVVDRGGKEAREASGREWRRVEVVEVVRVPCIGESAGRQ